MKPLVKIALKLLSSPKINMEEDYLWIRKVQRLFSGKPIRSNYRILDRKIYSADKSHDIPVRIFKPAEKKSDEVLLFFHGGGWVIGDINTYTKPCINMADLTGRTVYSVDYRLAPEFPYPAGLEDCYRVADAMLDNLSLIGLTSASQLTLIGDSAGGNLAAAVSLLLRDNRKDYPQKQILLYPITYWDHTENSPYESIRTKGTDYGLTAKKVSEYMDLYQPDREKRKSPYISPLIATDLTRQPNTLILTSENDPLRDEGEAYAKALKNAGNTVRVSRVKESVHGFITYPKISKLVIEAYQQINNFLDEE
ncbi:Acetyl esterase/lipase [Carnobacterium iners]|uniref:Acetyl esterase/lipase n=1 Tax=Carnobacterium iners TaxID=1073423 RepID=A0A1X7MZI9_9LACT|nr:alpha/beta hydrolase [Carnobacterium iners]SEK20720.1 Acetyl esterase/lipase [Carnobacterium iners]SMH30330.1 Acetyl esterase/lipase [Carnobacterium iners]